ncbi:glycosyltransferase family 4 protein [Sinomonas sp. RB5]
MLSREQAEYDAADFVLVPSDYALSEFLRQGFPSGKLLRHRYGCDLDHFPARIAGRPPGTPFRMCFVGRGDPTKGLHVALEAWHAANLSDARFMIAGKLEESYAESLRDRLADPRIAVRGFVDDVGALLSGSDVLLLPSSTEGSALVVYEAQATGCVPLVSAASGAFGEAGRHFLVHSVGDVERLASQMRTLAQHPDLLERLSGNCVADRDLFSWSAAGTALMDCYEKALAGAPRKAGVSEGMAG